MGSSINDHDSQMVYVKTRHGIKIITTVMLTANRTL